MTMRSSDAEAVRAPIGERTMWRRLENLLRPLARTLHDWRSRARGRRQLAQMPVRELRDIGARRLTRRLSRPRQSSPRNSADSVAGSP